MRARIGVGEDSYRHVEKSGQGHGLIPTGIHPAEAHQSNAGSSALQAMSAVGGLMSVT